MTTISPTTGDPYFIIAPLKNWNGGEFEIAPKLSIRHLNEEEMPDLQVSSHLLSGRDVDELQGVSYWLWYESQHTIPPTPHAHKRAIDFVEHAFYAVQILAPVGGKNVFLSCRNREGRLRADSGNHRQELQETMWSRLSGVPTTASEELPALLNRLHVAFSRNVVRIINPVRLLEHGLQATNPFIRILLWTTGLDALTMASGSAEFCERVSNLLGENTLVMPTDRLFHHQPKYRVQDVIKDLYELRSEVAHGRAISKKFQEKTGILSSIGKGGSMSGPVSEYRYRNVLEECAVFMLCKAVRKVVLLDLVNDVANERQWRRRLRSPV